jgi:predicted short-subunit dehydrogenase-like oxidoreductase (DUF2520 family)
MTATPRVFIVGPGRLGCSLGLALLAVDGPRLVGLAYRSATGRARAEEWLAPAGVPIVPVSDLGPDVLSAVDVVILAVQDSEVGAGARTLGPHLAAHQVLLHTSGLLSAAEMRGPAVSAALGSFHPLQTFVDPAAGPARLRGCVVACEGDDAAVRRSQQLATALGARSVRVASEGKAAYHAAAVVASNYLVVLTELAVRLCEVAGIAPGDAITMLAPLQRGALENLAEVGLPGALTGPLARGDVDTVRRHLAVIDARVPQLSVIYRALGERGLAMAREQGQEPERLAELERMLASD